MITFNKSAFVVSLISDSFNRLHDIRLENLFWATVLCLHYKKIHIVFVLQCISTTKLGLCYRDLNIKRLNMPACNTQI